jgi:hypothetical protein
MTTSLALIVIAAWAGVTLWAWRRASARQAGDQFIGLWRLPRGRQFYVDFYGLQSILALWMLADASAAGM